MCIRDSYRIEQILHSTVRYNCGETNKSANYKAFIGKVYAFVSVSYTHLDVYKRQYIYR